MADLLLILFDLNGVLYRYNRDARIARLSSLTNRPPETIKSAIWDSGFEDAGDAGALDATDYLRGFGTRIGYDLSESEWLSAQQVAVTPIVESLALLPRVRPGVQCAVLTNNNLLIRRHFASLYPEMGALVGERPCVSAEFSARKPDPEVYRRCVASLGVEPDATLFVDDSPANVEGARAAGLHVHHYTDQEGLATDLYRRGLLR